MKLNKFLLSAIAAASLTACSDNADVVENNKGHWNADGTGYVSLSISMPDNVGSKGSRTNTSINGSHNDQFDDGELNEYAVYDATLVIFTSDTDGDEGNYELTAAYNLPVDFKNTAEDKQISSVATVGIDKINATHAKALVILNMPSTIKLDKNAHMISLKNAEGTSESLANCTFAQFQKKVTEVPVILESGKGFTMTNAPLTTAQSVTGTITGTSTTTTLAKIDVNNIKQTAEEAKASPAARIYVERSVAKVTLKDNDENGHKLGNNDQIHYSIEGFVLDNTNPTTYIVRNAGETDNTWYNLKSEYFTTANAVADQYRFIGTTPVSATDAYYRTYWAEDPNYNVQPNEPTGLTLTSDTKLADDKLTKLTTGTGDNEHPLYCMENTFKVSSQTHRNTTRAILKVCFWRGTETLKPTTTPTLYMYNNDVETLLDDEGTDKNFTTKVLADLNSIPAVSGYKGGVKSVTYSTPTNGVQKIESVTYNDGTNTTENASSNSTVFELIQKHIGDIAVYENGCAYYSVLIKHFGDKLTPWNTWEVDPNKPAAGNIYPNNSDANYLGRYGVVRNNWYELGVKKVSKIGTPVITPPDNTPDDNIEEYISVNINILSWAKRSQDVDLQ